MSQPDPPTPDLGALDAATRQRLEHVRYPQRAMAMDVRTILAAYDALAAQLAEVESERDRLLTLNIERGVRAAGAERWAKRCQETIAAQAARLAEAKTEIARLTAELAECWDQFEKEQEHG